MNDSLNLIIITHILDSCGWIGENKLGFKGAAALFLPIQHAPLEIQIKYLPIMQKAVKEGKLRSNYFAGLKDRVLLRKGKMQIYGTQLIRDKKTSNYYISPLKDPKNVLKRRAKVGLGTFERVEKKYGIKWDVEKYIKNLPEIMQLQWPDKY